MIDLVLYGVDGLTGTGLGVAPLPHPVLVLCLRTEHPWLNRGYHRLGVRVGEAGQIDGQAGLRVHEPEL